MWKKNKPKKGEDVTWWQLARALTRRTMRAADAVFDAEFAAAYGVEYTEDLFAPANEDIQGCRPRIRASCSPPCWPTPPTWA